MMPLAHVLHKKHILFKKKKKKDVENIATVKEDLIKYSLTVFNNMPNCPYVCFNLNKQTKKSLK